MTDTEEKSWLENLRERRFFRFVISYLIAGWGIIQFMDWLVKRYALAPTLVDLVLVLLIALLPSVIILTYYHGRPGPDRWTRVEKIFIPLNVIIALGIVGFVFGGRSLGATAEQVQVRNELGEKETRLVPKQEYITRLSVFPVKLEDDLAETDSWLQLGIPLFLTDDLEQDPYIHTSSLGLQKKKFELFGHKLEDEVPFSLQRKLAEELYSDQFLTASLRREEAEYVLQFTQYTTADGKQMSEYTYRNADLMALIDQASSDLRTHLSVTDSRVGRVEQLDLPVADLYSASTEAQRHYVQGWQASYLGIDLETGKRELKAALDADPDFVMAYRTLAVLYMRNNQTADATRAIEEAMDRIDVLPERMQFEIRLRYYLIQRNTEKAISILEMWRQLFPANYFPYVTQMQLHLERSELHKAVEIGEEAIVAGHRGEIQLILAQVAAMQGKDEEAIAYYEDFAERYPERAPETIELGLIYMQNGDFEKAREHFDRLALLKPNDHMILTRQAQLEAAVGNVDQAEAQFRTALTKADSPADTAAVYLWMYYFYEGAGRISEAINILEARWEIIQKIKSPIEAGVEKLTYNYIQSYLDAGEKARYQRIRDEVFLTLPDPTGIFACMADLNYAIADRDSAALNAIYEPCMVTFRPVIGEQGMLMMDAYHDDLNGRYSEAMEKFTEYFETMSMQNASTKTVIMGELQLRAGNYQEAIEMLEEAIRQNPAYARHYLYMARAQKRAGNEAEARKYVQDALRLWENADPNYRYYREARELQEIL